MHPAAAMAASPFRPALARAACGLALLVVASRPLRADVVRLLADDRQAAQARVDLIQSAESELNVAYFAISDDEVGRAYLALLRDAARRGVTVRVLIDGLHNHLPAAVQLHLMAAGVQIREYHPPRCTHPLWLNRRMHDKLLIADRCRLILGSRNLDRRNFGLACRNFVDRDAYVCGCAAAAARDYFLCVWRSNEVRPANPHKPGLSDLCSCLKRNDPSCQACTLNAALHTLVARGLITLNAPPWEGKASAEPPLHLSDLEPPAEPQLLPLPSTAPHSFPCLADVRFLHDDCGRKHQPGAIAEVLLQLLAEARSSIVLESPYLVFSKELEAILLAARERGVEVVILTNSLASTDQTLVYAGYVNQRPRMLARGIHFWEFAGPEHFHAKSALVDDCVAMIGSYNFDPRSEKLNTETAILAADPGVAAALADSMAEHFARAWPIGPDGKPLGSPAKHPGADPLRQARLGAARLVAPAIKRHL